MSKKTKQTKNQKMFNRWILVGFTLAVVITTLIVILRQSGSLTTPTSRPAQEDAHASIIPPVEEVNFEARGVKSQPWVNPAVMRQTLDLILAYDAARELQTPTDRAIMRLAREYVDNKRPFATSELEVQAIGSDPSRPTFGRLAHNCRTDHYAFAHIQSNPVVLAVSVYHELYHGVDCAGYIADRTNPTNPLSHEPGAYAAQVRMFRALYHAGRYENLELSAEESSDTAVLQQTKEVWDALLSNSFSDWYRKKLQEGSDGELDVKNSVFQKAD